MANFIRYALAAVCFAASVGCLALWGWSLLARHAVKLSNPAGSTWVQARQGYINVTQLEDRWFPSGLDPSKCYQSAPITAEVREGLQSSIDLFGKFGSDGTYTYLPLWYPALCFALTGVGVPRFRRQFSIRSALIAVSAVAALLGVVVAL